MARGLATLVVAVVALATGGCGQKTESGNPGNGARSAPTPVALNPCPANATLAPTLPLGGSDETGLDCFAWASFVALNWRADPNKPGYPDPNAGPDTFGTPGDMSPKVWETYLEAASVFSGTLKGQWQAKRPAVKSLVRTSKFGTLDLSDIAQAGSGDHWLTSQRRELTYYEVMLNRDEYEFITTQKFDLTTAAGQKQCAEQPGKVIFDGPPPPPKGPLRGGLVLPEGTANGWDDSDCEGNKAHYGDGVGAMEVKAAWTPLPPDHSLDYRYKTAQAEIQDPRTKAMRKVTVGLVGLHIARKRFARHQWIWSTFEQIDNSPDEAANGGFTPPSLPANPNQKPSPGFTYFNPQCVPAKDPVYQCQHNRPPRPCGTSGIVCDPYDAPMQITRLNPVPAAANNVTAWFWSLMPANSVFNYYRLVNVQWPTQPGMQQTPGERVPLGMGTPMPQGASGGTGQILANTTLESFQQSSASCMDCHVYAQVASPPTLKAAPNGLRRIAKGAAGGAPPPYASDFSFVFVTETKR